MRTNKYTQRRKGIVTPYGQWKYPGKVTTIPSNDITMQGVPYPVLGVSDAGDVKMMMPGIDYLFNGNEVTEYPIIGKHQSKPYNGVQKPPQLGYSAPPIDSSLKGNELKEPYFKKLAYGSNEDTRKRVREEYPMINEKVDSVANAYNISPQLLNTRLDNEGFIDHIAYLHDKRTGTERLKPIDFTDPLFSGFDAFGLDDVPMYIANGIVKPINEKWHPTTVPVENEKGREIFPAEGETWIDNLGLMAATLKGFRDQAIKDFPGLSDNDYNRLANAYYNKGIEGGRRWWKSGGNGNDVINYQTGGIHIKKENRGKFTEAAKRAGKSVQEYARQILANKENYSPTLVKRANFARNASKFKHQEGGNRPSFEEYYQSLPAYKNDTTNYDLRTAYQYLPYEEMKQFSTIPDKHLSSVVELPDGSYRFLKSKNHPSLQQEIDWYNSDDAKEFRNNYTLDTSGEYYRYVPKKHQIGKYLEGNYVQPQTVGNVMNSWNDMLAKGLSKGDNIANWVGTGLQAAATAAGSIASQWGAENGKQDWMNGKKQMSAEEYLTSPQFGQDLAASVADYEDTTEYAELPQEVLQYQQKKRNDDFFRNTPRKDLRDNISATPVIKQNATIDPFDILNGINVERNQPRNTNPINPFNMLPGIHSPSRIDISGYNNWLRKQKERKEQGESSMLYNMSKFATGGNTPTLAEIERGEIVSTPTGNSIANGRMNYHELYSNDNEQTCNIVNLTDNMQKDVAKNPQLSPVSKRVNRYTSMRRNGNTFIFPSTVGLNGRILEPKKGVNYPLAELINNR